MQDSEIVKRYAEHFVESLPDAVTFAKDYLGFQPFNYQEEFLRDQSPLSAACCGRQVGKTTLAAIKALHFALAGNGVRILIVSAGLRQSMILFDKILEMSEAALPARLLTTYKTITKIRFANGSEIVALPCGRDGSTLRGFTSDMVILDEANFIPRIVIESVVRPTMITRPAARLIMISTPWMRDHPFYEALSEPELGFKTYTWPTSMNPMISEERLELEKKTIGEYDFNREYNAIFLDDQFSYFPSTLVLGCTDDYNLNSEPKPGEKYKGQYYIGIDFGKHADHSAIAILQKTPEDELRLVYLKQFELDTPYTTVIGNVRLLNEAYRFRAGYLDETGVGEGPYEEIHNFMPAMKGVTLTAKAKQEILGRLKLAMEQHRLTLPRDDSRLLVQMTAQRCEPTMSGTLKFSHPPGTHDDELWSLALAAYASLEPPYPRLTRPHMIWIERAR
jgi:phage FluMu gp28-like protein